ncbi:hypothetical protein LP415_03545 [Polaromonas sp. P1(28)-8]|nr:hypothetical protein LP415_03545 [Polaromonas sp. P1(28)-8]
MDFQRYTHLCGAGQVADLTFGSATDLYIGVNELQASMSAVKRRKSDSIPERSPQAMEARCSFALAALADCFNAHFLQSFFNFYSLSFYEHCCWLAQALIPP